MKFILLLFLFLMLYFQNFGQDTISKFRNLEFFPTVRQFPILFLDPLACQIYGGIHVMYEEGQKNQGVFIPVNIGFSKPFFGIPINNASLEIGLEATSYTQFEIVQVEGNTYMGGLFNNDYKASAYISLRTKNLLYRTRLFHISSHLGDDYMIRNEDFSRNDKSVNYEQVDITLLKRLKNVEYYLGSGYVFTPNAFRERFSLQTGMQFDIQNQKAYHLIGGIDIKSFQQNDFYPNIRAAIGTSFNKNTKPEFRLQLEIYHGHLPYSTQEYRKVSWIGISSIIDIGKMQ